MIPFTCVIVVLHSLSMQLWALAVQLVARVWSGAKDAAKVLISEQHPASATQSGGETHPSGAGPLSNVVRAAMQFVTAHETRFEVQVAQSSVLHAVSSVEHIDWTQAPVAPPSMLASAPASNVYP
jgi:hypothetical protein